MASLSSLGVGSGLDAEAIVTKLVAIEKQPADALTTKNTKLQTQVSTWGKIQSNFSALQDAASKLMDSSFWSATTGKSSDDASVSVTTGSNAAAGNYAVNVTQLAAAQSVASATSFTNSTSAVGEGTLRIELGTYTTTTTPPAVTFAAKAAATAVDITIGPGDNTLEKIRDRINTANAGISATIVTDASGARLVMRGQNGEENAFRVSVTETSTAPGLSALAYSAATGDTSSMNRTQSAQNALATINGLSVSSATNTLSNVVDGVTLKLNKTTASPATVTIDLDTTSISKGVNDFVSAYNSVVSTIRVQSLYDETSKTAGPLQGNATARGLLSQMRSLISSNTSASSTFSRLSDIGIDINTDGTLAIKSTMFNDAMGKLGELQKFFAGSSDTDSSLNGIGTRIKNLTKQILDTSSGAIANSTSGLNSTITRNKTKIEGINDHASKVETRLRAQYTALDTSMAKLSGLSTYVTAQLAALNKSS